MVYEFYAVFDRRRIPQKTIDGITSPYGIWENRLLNGRSPEDPAYIFSYAPLLQEPAYAERTKELESLKKDPNLVVKKVYCNN